MRRQRSPHGGGRWATLASAPLAALAVGCAGGSPLLHPARPLGRGEVTGHAGTSAHFAPGPLADALARAREVASQTGPNSPLPATSPAFAEGALVAASVAPGLAPFVAGRVGVGSGFEGGIAHTGRAARIDLRRGFGVTEAVDLSAGLGVSVPFYGGSSGSLAGIDLAKLSGYGVDLPILVGAESGGGLYKGWAGVRGAFEHASLSNLSSDPRPGLTGPTPLEVDRLGVGVVIGVAVGLRHLHVAMELQGGWTSLTGRVDGAKTSISGLTLTPASALSWQF